jgi:hypothetical protein
VSQFVIYWLLIRCCEAISDDGSGSNNPGKVTHRKVPSPRVWAPGIAPPIAAGGVSLKHTSPVSLTLNES